MVHFAQSQLTDSGREIVIFTAYIENKSLQCAISYEALQDHFDGNTLKPIDTFVLNRRAIERIAEKLITQRRFESDDSILIRTSDC